MQTIQTIRFAVIALLAITAFSACRKDAALPSSEPTATAPAGQVLTPVGYMESSKVHFIAPGFHLNVEKGRLQKVETRSGKVVEDFGEVGTVEKKYNRLAQAVEAAGRGGSSPVIPYVQGWIAYTYWNNSSTSTPITNFTTTWKVPSAPSRKGSQTVFLFNGMQDGTTSTSYIIQPVLQWGPSAAGGGKYWAITNWYVSASQAFYGSLVTVSSGTSLTGVMTETAVSGSNYSYNSSFTGYSSSSALQVNNVPQAYWAAETLESYSVSTPSTMYPTDSYVALTGIGILEGTTHPTITWTPVQATSGAAQKAVVVSNSTTSGEVDIYFR